MSTPFVRKPLRFGLVVSVFATCLGLLNRLEVADFFLSATSVQAAEDSESGISENFQTEDLLNEEPLLILDDDEEETSEETSDTESDIEEDFDEEEESEESSGPIEQTSYNSPSASSFTRKNSTARRSFNGPGTIGRVGHNAFKTLGRNSSITNVEIMPYMIDGDSMWFTDFRFFLGNNQQFGGNAGFGYRKLINRELVIGSNFFYDADETSRDLFHQIGFGLEAYTEEYDFRSNFYFPIGDTQGDTLEIDQNYRFVDSSIQYDLELRTNEALHGADVEFGLLLPTDFAEDHNFRVFGGYYHFQGDNVENINGVKVRAQADLNEALQLQVEYTNDDTFGSNVMFAAHWLIPSGPGRSKRSNPINLFEEFVNRNYNIIAGESVDYEYGLVVPDTDNELSIESEGPPSSLVVKHVYSSEVESESISTHTGTVDDPFETIAAAQASGADIIFVHAGSVLSESVVVQDGQRILGEGGTYLFDNGQFSNVLLPNATTNDGLPILYGSGGNGFTLGSDSEVAGFIIDGSSGYGLYANGTTNGYVNQVQIMDSLGGGIGLEDVSGEFLFSDIQIDDASGNGLAIYNSDAQVTITGSLNNSSGRAIDISNHSTGALDFSGLTVTGDGGTGIYLEDLNSDVVFNNLSLSNSSSTGIRLDGGSGEVTFGGTTTVQNSADTGIVVENFEGDVNFDEVSVTDNVDAMGVSLADNTGSISFEQLDISNEGETGLKVRNNSDLVIEDGNLETVSGTALDIEDSETEIELTSVSSSDAEYGLRYVNSTGSLLIYGDKENAGSGGTISGADTGIFVSGSELFAMQYMTLDGNDTGINIVDTDSSYLAYSLIKNSDGFGLDAMNARFVNVTDLFFETNGTSDHNRIRYRADEFGEYELNIKNTTVAANEGSAVLIQSLAGAEGSSFGGTIRYNDIILSSTAENGIYLDWEGPTAAAILNNQFVANDGNKTAIKLNTPDDEAPAALTIQDNLFQMNGSNDTAIDITNAGSSQFFIGQNYIYMNDTYANGMIFNLAENSNVTINQNYMEFAEHSGTAILFDEIEAPSLINMSQNLIYMNQSSLLVDRGIIFEDIEGIVNLYGADNLVSGASESFAIPEDNFYGSININGAQAIGTATDDDDDD